MKSAIVRCGSALACLALIGGCTTKGKSADTVPSTMAPTITTLPLPTSPVAGQTTTLASGSLGVSATTTVVPDAVIRVSGRYVGRVDQDPSISAAVVSDGFSVMAYFTNGKNISTWFRGPLLAGGVIVRKVDGDTLRAIVEPQVVRGVVVLPDGREVTFSGVPAGEDQGLFRKAEFRNGVLKVQGWIVQNDGAAVSRAELSYAPTLVPSPTLPAPPVKKLAPNLETTTSSSGLPQALPTSTLARAATTLKPIAATARPNAPVLAAADNIDPTTKVNATTDDVAPPTPNGPLRFVISASGDSLASGEGAPDVSGKYEGPDFAACRTSANSFSAYTPADLAALGTLPGFGSRLVITPGVATAHVADAQAALAAYVAAQANADAARRSVQTATAAVTRAKTPETAAALTAATATARAADGSVSAAAALMIAKVGPVTIDVERVLPAALRNDRAYTQTATFGPLTNIAALTTPQRAAFRFAAFWTSYQPCVTQPMKRIIQEQWQSGFTQSKPETATGATVADDDATRCHRSMNAPAALAAAALTKDLPEVNVVYRSFACAGSDSTAIDETPFAGIEPPKDASVALAPQTDQLAAWARGNGVTNIDSFYLGMGAGTATFGVTPAVCALPFAEIAGKDCRTIEAAAVASATKDVSKRMAAVQTKLGSLAPATTTGPTTLQAITAQFESGPAPVRLSAIHVPSIPDIATGTDSKPCPGVAPLTSLDRSLSDHLTGQASTQLTTDVVPALNSALQAAVKAAKWDLISGIQAAFTSHGFCATDPWIHTSLTANAQQAALIGKTPSSAGAPDRMKSILPDTALTRTVPSPANDSAAVSYQVAQIAGNELPIGGLQANTAMLLPNSTGYRNGYLPLLLESVRSDARGALTPADPDQLRADPAPDGVTLRWRDRSVNELTYVVTSPPDTAQACGTSSLAPLKADSQTVTLTVTAGTSCSFAVQACGAKLAGKMLCSKPDTATFTATPPPPPKNIVSVLGNQVAVVQWDPVPNATHYVVHLQLSNGTSLATVTDSTSVSLPEGGESLPGGQHNVLVRSCATSCGADGPVVPINPNAAALPTTTTSTTSTTSTTTPTTTTTTSQPGKTTTIPAVTTRPVGSPTVTTMAPSIPPSPTAAPSAVSTLPVTTRATTPVPTTTIVTTTTTATIAPTAAPTTTRPATSTTTLPATSLPATSTTTLKP